MPTPLSRRRALGLGGLLLAGSVAACDLDPGAPGSSRSSSPVPTSGAPSAPSQDADLALLDDARTALSETLDLVRATRRRHRPLRGELGPLAQAHRRHLEVLAGAGRESSAGPSFPPVVPPRATAALAAVAQQERRLQVRLVRSAGEAGSGELARLLASISASCAQHVAAFPEGP